MNFFHSNVGLAIVRYTNLRPILTQNNASCNVQSDGTGEVLWVDFIRKFCDRKRCRYIYGNNNKKIETLDDRIVKK